MSEARMPAMKAPCSCSAGFPLPRVSVCSADTSSSAASVNLRCSTSASSRSAGPPCSVTARIDMNERPVPGPGRINAGPANKLRVRYFDAIHSGLDYLAVRHGDTAVMVEVVHQPVSVGVDEYVDSVAVHMTAELGAPSGIPSADVVLRRAEAAHHPDSADVDATRLKIGQNELELVDELDLEHEVLGPNVRLVVREKVAQGEVLRDGRIGVIRGDLDEARRIRVGARQCLLRADATTTTMALGWPVSDVIEAYAPTLLRAEGKHGDDAEIGDGSNCVANGDRDAPHPRAARLGVSGSDVAPHAVAHLGTRRERVGLYDRAGGVDRCAELAAEPALSIEDRVECRFREVCGRRPADAREGGRYCGGGARGGRRCRIDVAFQE